jgi:hypothetical protein
MARRAHVVPRGFQRYFAEGEQITLVDKRNRTGRLVGTKDAFVSNGLLTVRINGTSSDEMEDEFARVESHVLPALARIRPGEWPTGEDHLLMCAAGSLLWARSFGAEELRNRISTEMIDRSTERFASHQRFARIFRAQHGRDPARSDVEETVRESMRQIERERQVAVSAIARHYMQGIERFSAMDYDVLAASTGHEFVTSDSPVLLGLDPEFGAVGMHNRIGIEKAQAIYVPIRRTVAVRFHREGPGTHRRLLPRAMAVLNNAMWRNAVRWVACHPSVDWRRACSV